MAERSRRHGGEKLRKFAAVMVCLLMSGFWALPAHAAGCYPPPCAAPAGAPTLTANGQGAPLPAIGLKNGAGRTPAAPFVAVGLVMVATTFSTIALLRRLAVVRRSRPVPARTERKDGVGWAKAGKFARLVDR